MSVCVYVVVVVVFLIPKIILKQLFTLAGSVSISEYLRRLGRMIAEDQFNRYNHKHLQYHFS